MPLAIAVRPEKIDIGKSRPSVDSNLFTGKVKEIAYFGSYNTYVVAASGRIAGAHHRGQHLAP